MEVLTSVNTSKVLYEFKFSVNQVKHLKCKQFFIHADLVIWMEEKLNSWNDWNAIKIIYSKIHHFDFNHVRCVELYYDRNIRNDNLNEIDEMINKSRFMMPWLSKNVYYVVNEAQLVKDVMHTLSKNRLLIYLTNHQEMLVNFDYEYNIMVFTFSSELNSAQISNLSEIFRRAIHFWKKCRFMSSTFLYLTSLNPPQIMKCQLLTALKGGFLDWLSIEDKLSLELANKDHRLPCFDNALDQVIQKHLQKQDSRIDFTYLRMKYFIDKDNPSCIREQSYLNLQGGEPEPEFEGTISNVTFPAGREAILTCSVRNLGRFKVGWLRASDQTVLALQGRVVTHNARISVVHEDLHTWRLRIKQLRETDRGCYMCQINSSPMKKQIGCIDVQVPPDIINEESSADIAVQEGEDATLTCRATGNPIPRVTWKREDGESIYLRKPGTREIIKVESYNGTLLRLPRLERRQMGAYLCIASNDVPPAVSKRVSLSVHFSPSVRAPSQLLGAPLGSDVQLECQVEASPAPVSYWLKGGRMPPTGFAGSGNLEAGQPRPEMLLDGPKYGITEQRTGYRGIMRLVVRSFSQSDVGTYHCVSTNSLGRAEGTLRLYEIKLHPGGIPSDDDQLNIIGGLAEAARGRGNSSANLPQMTKLKTTVFFVTSLGTYVTFLFIR